MTDERFQIEITIGAPADEVWAALREPDRIRQWHGWHYDGLDKEIELIYRQDVTESAADHRLEVQGGDLFELTPVGGATRLRLTRAPRGGDPAWDAYYDDVTEGWITFVQQLRFVLERHPDGERRTVFLTGSGAGLGGVPLLEAAGLASVAELPPEEPYDETAVTGEELSGRVWFRSAHQTGLTVGSWGDGLLVVAQAPPSAPHPEGVAMMVLTTFGLDDAAFADLEARWTAWWAATFPE